MRDAVLQALGLVHPAPAQGQPRREFLVFMTCRRGSVPSAVYEELVELHDRMRRLEQQVAELGGPPGTG